MPEKIDELRKAWELHEKRPFPRDHSDDELSRLHADLVLYDDYVAGTVARILGGERTAAREIRPDKRLREKLHAICEDGGARSDVARRYLEYVDKLDELLRLAKAVGR